MHLHDLQVFKKLAKRFPTPKHVQKALKSFHYNREQNGETLRSAIRVHQTQTAHCLEACFYAAAILEQQGYPPLVMSMESQDSLDHVIFVFKERTGWGSVARSRDIGLHGREPRFRSLRDLAWSYFDSYVDSTGRLTGYGVANLDDSGADWRYSRKNVWKAEQYLIDLKHKKLKSSRERYLNLLARFKEQGPIRSGKHWW